MPLPTPRRWQRGRTAVLPDGNAGFARVQVLRAFAALMVVGVHLTARSHQYLHRPLVHDVLDFGASGVDVFFVISGFVLATVHAKDVGHRERVRGFVTKRLVRIFPLYWIVTLLLLPVYLGGYGEASKRSVGVVARSFVLLPQEPGVFPIVNVGWTLTFELFFYLMFALLIALPLWAARLTWAAWLLPTGGLALAELAGGQHPLRGHVWLDLVFSARSLEFLLGCLVGLAVQRGRVPAPALLLWSGVGLYLLVGVDPWDWGLTQRSVLVFGLTATLMVAGAAALDRRGTPYRGPRWAVRLGDASYALYLIHFSLVVLAFRLMATLPHLPTGLYEALVAAVVVAICGLALQVHFLVERPLIRWLRQRLLPGEGKDPDSLSRLARA